MTSPYTTAATRLASYGSLAPGKVNNHQLDGPRGHWIPGTVNGKLFEGGWGSALGFPALILDPSAPEVPVHVFESPDLPAHWSRLDEFEGSSYRRVVTSIRTAQGDLSAHIYVFAQ